MSESKNTHAVSLLLRQFLPFPTSCQAQTLKAKADGSSDTNRTPLQTEGAPRCRRKDACFSRQFAVLLGKRQARRNHRKRPGERPWPRVSSTSRLSPPVTCPQALEQTLSQASVSVILFTPKQINYKFQLFKCNTWRLS